MFIDDVFTSDSSYGGQEPQRFYDRILRILNLLPISTMRVMVDRVEPNFATFTISLIVILWCSYEPMEFSHWHFEFIPANLSFSYEFSTNRNIHVCIIFSGWHGLCLQLDCWHWCVSNAWSDQEGWMVAGYYSCYMHFNYQVSLHRTLISMSALMDIIVNSNAVSTAWFLPPSFSLSFSPSFSLSLNKKKKI